MGNGSAKGGGMNKFTMLTHGNLLKTPWRSLSWDEQTRYQLIETIKEYQPLNQVGVSCAKILLLGHVNVGKSSFFNSINSIFRNHVTAQAPVGSPRDQRSITTRMRAYQIRNGREGKILNFKIVDSMGIEDEKRKGFDTTELPYVLDGHVPDNHQFDPAGNISPEMAGFNKIPSLHDKVHCCVFVLDANEITNMNEDFLGKMSEMRTKITGRGIPLIVLVTKIDRACSHTGADLSLVYKSTMIQHIVAQASTKIGVPVSHVLPVKNYTHEIELDPWVDLLALSALQQMLRFTDNYFDECLVQTQSGYVQPEKSSNDAWTRNATMRTNPNSSMKQAWSSGNGAGTPTAVAGRIPGVSVQNTPLGKSLMNGTHGTPMSRVVPSEKEQQPVEILEEESETPDPEKLNQVSPQKVGENIGMSPSPTNVLPQEIAA